MIVMSKKSLQSKKFSQYILPGILAVLLCAAIIVASFALSENQDIRQQASVGNFDSLSQGEGCQGSDCAEDDGQYSSETGIYQINFDPQLWTEMSLPETADKNDQEQAYFVLRNSHAFASVYLSVLKRTTVQPDFIAHGNTESIAELEQLAQDIEQKLIKRQEVDYGQYSEYQGYEIMADAYQRPAIRFDYQYHALEKIVPYSEYVFVGEDYLLEAELRFVATAAVKTHLEKFLQNISLTENKLTSKPGLVKGESTVATNYNSTQIAELVKPSVVQILHLYCKEIKVNQVSTSLMLKSSYPFCSAGVGTGFIVDEKGYVATNGHVVSSHKEQDMIEGLMSGNMAVYTFLGDLLRELYAQEGVVLTEEEGMMLLASMLYDPAATDALAETIYELFDQELIEVNPVKDLLYISASNKSFDIAEVDELTQYNIETVLQNSSSLFEAKLVNINYANMFAKDVLFDGETASGSDVALISIDSKAGYLFPAVPLNSANSVKEGDQIIVVGYPGLVSGMSLNPLLDYEASGGIATITQGIISSKKTDKSGNVLLQTDASIEHGNSGGPALNLSGDVIGIATYGLESSSGNYNFLRDAKDLLPLADSSSLNLMAAKEGTYQTWNRGLNYFWQKRYSKALAEFSKVKNNYLIHPSVGDYMVQAEDGIKAGEDIDLLFGVQKNYLYAALVALVLLILGSAVFVLIKRKKTPAAALPQLTQDQLPLVSPTPVMPVVEQAAQLSPQLPPELPSELLSAPVQSAEPTKEAEAGQPVADQLSSSPQRFQS